MCVNIVLILLVIGPCSGGVWRGDADSEKESWWDGIRGAVEGVTRTTGKIVPMRGLAGYMADAGIPGGSWLRNTLTPPTMKNWDRLDQQPSFRNDFLYLVGAVLGEEECIRMLACRSGKRVSSLPGTSLLTMGLAGIGEYVPESLRGSYSVLRDSLLYSDDCQQFQCHPTTGISALSSAADDLGIPGGTFLSQYFPDVRGWIPSEAREGKAVNEMKIATEKHILQQLVLAVAGNQECANLLACTMASRTSSIPGAGTLAYFLGTQSEGIPSYMAEIMDVFRMSVMLRDDCSQYSCPINNTIQDLGEERNEEKIEKLTELENHIARTDEEDLTEKEKDIPRTDEDYLFELFRGLFV